MCSARRKLAGKQENFRTSHRTICKQNIETVCPMKASSIGACASPEEAESRNDKITREILEVKNPIVVSSQINKNKSVTKAASRFAISKGDVHMDKVQVEIMFLWQSTTSRCLGNRGIGTQQHWEFSIIDPLPIKTCLNDMLVIAEAMAAHSSMEFLRRPASLSV
jgi:hypothetical protein